LRRLADTHPHVNPLIPGKQSGSVAARRSTILQRLILPAIEIPQRPANPGFKATLCLIARFNGPAIRDMHERASSLTTARLFSPLISRRSGPPWDTFKGLLLRAPAAALLRQLDGYE